MPALIVNQHELFAQQIVGGASQAEAARRAGYGKTAINVGCRLMKREDVIRRVEELRALACGNLHGDESLAATPLGRIQFYKSEPYVIEQLVSTHQLAKAKGELSVSVQCLTRLAQLGGLLNDGSGGVRDRSRDREAINVLLMSAAQLNDALRKQIGQVPAAERKQLVAAEPELAEIIEAMPLDEVSEKKDT